MESMDVLGEITLLDSNGQTRIEWKIPNFFSLQNILYSSPEFIISNTKCFLQLFPNFGEPSYTSLSLEMKKAAVQHRVEFRMGIKKCDGSDDETEKFVYMFKKKKNSTLLCNLILRNVLWLAKHEFISEDCLIVFCKIRNITDVPETESTKQITSLCGTEVMSENFKGLYLSKQFADFKIVVKNKEFLAHKSVLAARSKVFSAMLQHDTAENRSGTLNISDCEPETFEDFLIFLYSGDFVIVTTDNAASLYRTSDKYDLNDLKEECYRCMMRDLTEDSFCDTVLLAHTYNEFDLLSAATRFFIKNVKKIVVTEKWQSLMVEKPSLCNELVVKLVNADEK